MKFSTRAIHCDKEKLAVSPPIFQTSSFRFEDLNAAQEIMSGKRQGYAYSRTSNPTVTVLEETMASLEGAGGALCFGSGMAAISALFFSTLRKGDHLLADEVLYGSTYDLISGLLPKFGIEVTFTDLSDAANLERETRSNTKLIFYETPTNPTMKLIDVEEVGRFARENGVLSAVDNTFMTPYYQRPLSLGADIVVHSATKYLNGHGDALGGVLLGSPELIKRARGVLRDTGGALSPFNAWLIHRGLETLSARMDRHSRNAQEIARFLEEHGKVSRVLYPGLASHPQHALAARQMSGPGGMVSFELGSRGDVKRMLDGVKLCTLAVSLGDVKTLIQHPASMTHAVLPPEKRQRYGISEEMVRLSVGLEDASDIIDDLAQALG